MAVLALQLFLIAAASVVTALIYAGSTHVAQRRAVDQERQSADAEPQPEWPTLDSDSDARARGEAEGARLHHEWAAREGVVPCGCGSPTCSVDHPAPTVAWPYSEPEQTVVRSLVESQAGTDLLAELLRSRQAGFLTAAEYGAARRQVLAEMATLDMAAKRAATAAEHAAARTAALGPAQPAQTGSGRVSASSVGSGSLSYSGSAWTHCAYGHRIHPDLQHHDGYRDPCGCPHTERNRP